jgi:hypothetical protein
MKVMETVEIPATPARTEERLSHIVCDLCGARGDLDHGGVIDWPEATRDNSQIMTSVMIKRGMSFPDGGHWNEDVYHVCPECFRGKLAKWFEERGVQPTTGEIVW